MWDSSIINVTFDWLTPSRQCFGECLGGGKCGSSASGTHGFEALMILLLRL